MTRVTAILKEHEALKNGDKVLFYDKYAYREIRKYLDSMYSSEKRIESDMIFDYGGDYRPWGDGVHASCFVCWCDCEGTQFMKGFDCYV